MSDDQDKNGKAKDSLWLFIVLMLLICIIWGASWFLVARYLPDWQSRSSFGEMFGAVNALFSGAALAGVIFAILLQRRELMLQRRELEMTRKELRRSVEAQEKSEKALVEQAKALEMAANFQEKSQATLNQQAESLALTARLNALSFLPTLSCGFQLDNARVIFTVLNPGTVPAFDVDVFIVGNYHEDEIDIPTFIESYVVRNKKELDDFVADEGFFGVFDRL